ncbi:hypothetical protein EYC80_010332 [Monilinia laxa]|uniref:2EXR domain-containing protein n=1 Tax=Monilinia laxa TaxID=61186 RepID=A0A5N6JNF0_MONLA|nr:hypothetical protein EYC80_010332 [Monilinia laxa]
MDSSSMLFSPSQARAWDAIQRSRGSFTLFERLPIELQVIIIKMAFPSGRVIPLAFNTTLLSGPRDITLHFKILPDIYLTPLMNTSTLFNHQVHHDYRKIKVQTLTRGSKTQIFTPLPQSKRPWNMFPQQGRRNNFSAKNSGYRSLAHVYLQPKIDTLLIDYQELFKLYLVGGSIDLSSVTHLALLNAPNRKFSYNLWLKFDESDVAHLMYSMLSTQCPALKKLSLIVGLEQDIGKMCIESKDLIFDITDEFWSLDWEGPDGEPKNLRTAEVSNMARSLRLDFQRFPQHSDPKYEVSADTALFWQDRESVPGLIARLDEDEMWFEDGKNCAEPRLFFRDIDGYLPAHRDGTILDKYKGMAQIFDGAAW